VALSKQIQSYWVNFAKTGNPNGPGLPHWPAFGASSQRVMYLDAHTHAGPVPNMRQIRVFDAYHAWRREEAKKKQAN
jgi:para-nitrobenzyl esterase